MTVARYGKDHPVDHIARDWLGVVSTDHWLLYEAADGTLVLYVGRDEETGGVGGSTEVIVAPDREVTSRVVSYEVEEA